LSIKTVGLWKWLGTRLVKNGKTFFCFSASIVLAFETLVVEVAGIFGGYHRSRCFDLGV
jgi:hypothetical protein